MCGINGIISLSNQTINSDKIISMNNSIKHRGPDDEGYYLHNNQNNSSCHYSGSDTLKELIGSLPEIDKTLKSHVALGFRRLSIIDTSINGHQPMSDSTNRFTIIFNGEIYNHLELRSELVKCNYNFKTNSDTEVLLNSYLHWGDQCVNKFVGMWAFAIYDSIEKILFCSRDRFGIKPFYYTFTKDYLSFSSEIKSLLHISPFEVNNRAIYYYLASGISNFDKETFYKNIYSLEPGHNLIVKDNNITINKYHNIKQNKIDANNELIYNDFRHLFKKSIQLTHRADTPLSYSLSGGLDSSSIVCFSKYLFKSIQNKEFNTFSIVFPENEKDESKFIDIVNNHVNAIPNKSSIKMQDLEDDIFKFCLAIEEPFGGLSYFGEYKLREEIHKKGFKISIEGQGADEILTGYDNLYEFYLFDLINNFRILKFIKELSYIKTKTNTSIIGIIKGFVKQKLKITINEDLSKYPYIDKFFFEKNKNTFKYNRFHSDSYLNDELYKQLTISSIPEQLVKADKLAMSHSIEARFPFLDNELVSYCLNINSENKINNGISKHILRESLRKELPTAIYNRKDKIGFAVPSNLLVSEKLWDILNNEINRTTLSFIDTKQFNEHYKTINDIDWKYWKIVSLILWHNTYRSYTTSITPYDN